MRIHPLSRRATDRDSGRPYIVARIEFFDAFGHTCKGVGQIRIDLLAIGPAKGSLQRLTTYAKDFSDLSINRDHYDDVTRTYRFHLELDRETLPEKLELRACFLSANGQRLEATYCL